MEVSLEEEYRKSVLNRCSDVIKSCKTEKQLIIAVKYCYMFKNVYIDFEHLYPKIWSMSREKQIMLSMNEHS